MKKLTTRSGNMLKTIAITVIILSLSGNVFCQQTAQDHLAKSRAKKTTGYVFLGVGAAMVAVGTTIATSGPNDLSGIGNAVTGTLILISGITCAFMSLPFFASASKHKRLATELALKTDHRLQFTGFRWASNYYPAVSIKLKW